jgi:hypothetical protein
MIYRGKSASAILFITVCSLFVSLSSVAAQDQSKAPPKTKLSSLTGFVGDTTCGITHISGGAKKCTVRCVKNMGSKYALVIGQKIYTLEGKEAELEKLAGERAKVTGTLQGSTMKVASVASAKFEEAPDMD